MPIACHPRRRYCRKVIIINYLHHFQSMQLHLYINYLSISISHVNADITLKISILQPVVLAPKNMCQCITSINVWKNITNVVYDGLSILQCMYVPYAYMCKCIICKNCWWLQAILHSEETSKRNVLNLWRLKTKLTLDWNNLQVRQDVSLKHMYIICTCGCNGMAVICKLLQIILCYQRKAEDHNYYRVLTKMLCQWKLFCQLSQHKCVTYSTYHIIDTTLILGKKQKSRPPFVTGSSYSG